MRMMAQFLKTNEIRQRLRKLNPNLRVTAGFFALLDCHLESILKRSVAGRFKKGYLDAADALVASRLPFQIMNSQIKQAEEK